MLSPLLSGFSPQAIGNKVCHGNGNSPPLPQRVVFDVRAIRSYQEVHSQKRNLHKRTFFKFGSLLMISQTTYGAKHSWDRVVHKRNDMIIVEANSNNLKHITEVQWSWLATSVGRLASTSLSAPAFFKESIVMCKPTKNTRKPKMRHSTVSSLSRHAERQLYRR